MTAPASTCRCAELTAQVEQLTQQQVYLRSCSRAAIDAGETLIGQLSRNRIDAEAESERLRKALLDVEFVLDPNNNPELEPWRRAELAGQYVKAALIGGAA